MTDEVKSALYTLFRFLNWHRSIVASVYQTRNYARYEGRAEEGACSDVELLDLVPASVNFPYMSNGSLRITPSATSRFGPVTPDGQPMANQMFGRDLSDPSYYSNEVDNSGSTSVTSTSSSVSSLIARPSATQGATPLSPYPFAATAGIVVDKFSGISFRELGTAAMVWSEVVKAAAAATGHAEADDQNGAKVFYKQSLYTYVFQQLDIEPKSEVIQTIFLIYRFLLWHAEYSEITGYRNVEDIWTNVTLDAEFATQSA